jgi:hypothetical protein
MFDLRRRSTVIAEGLKIVGSVTAEGLVEVNGRLYKEMVGDRPTVGQRSIANFKVITIT